MANDDAWALGFNLGAKRGNKDNADAASSPASSSGIGGLPGLIGKGIKALRGKNAGAGGGQDTNTDTALSNTVGVPVQQTTFKATPFKKGGWVKKTGLALVHKGEFVIPAKHHRSSKKASRKLITKH